MKQKERTLTANERTEQWAKTIAENLRPEAKYLIAGVFPDAGAAARQILPFIQQIASEFRLVGRVEQAREDIESAQPSLRKINWPEVWCVEQAGAPSKERTADGLKGIETVEQIITYLNYQFPPTLGHLPLRRILHQLKDASRLVGRIEQAREDAALIHSMSRGTSSEGRAMAIDEARDLIAMRATELEPLEDLSNA